MKTRRPGPFDVQVRDIVNRPGEMREVTFDVSLGEQWGEGLVSIEKGSVVEVDARLESVHEGILVSAIIDATYAGECGRCLRDISEGVEVEFQELFAYPGGEASDFEVQDDHVDLETPVRDALVLALPFQPVCQPDCLGLDPETGERLTAVPETPSTEPVDPRWAALQGFTDQSTGRDASGAQHTEES